MLSVEVPEAQEIPGRAAGFWLLPFPASPGALLLNPMLVPRCWYLGHSVELWLYLCTEHRGGTLEAPRWCGEGG